MTRIIVNAPGDGGSIEFDDAAIAARASTLAAPGGPEPPPVRLAFAAAHVALSFTYAECERADPETIAEHVDWPATLAFRHHLAARGFGIAEAMDTAQRFEIGWPTARRLIRETGGLALPTGFVAGAATDQLESVRGTGDLVDAVVEQATIIRMAGGIPVILPMPWLAEQSCPPDTYVEVYRDIIREVRGPVFIHWLGPMFLPALRGYFPGDSFERVMDLDPETVRGAKLSLLDADLEVRLRRRLLERDQVMLTGDDLHFSSLIEGDGAPPARHTVIAGQRVALGDFSHALLGILDGIALPAGVAMRFLARGDVETYRALMQPCEELARLVFAEPTSAYKAGLAFLAWLDGHQSTPMLVNRRDRERTPEELLRIAAAAARAGVFRDAGTAAERLAAWCDVVFSADA